jgi:O-antigen/teichoic acid export membrane protein
MLGLVTWQFRAALIAGVVQVSLIVGLYFLGDLTPQAVFATSLLSVGLTWLLVVTRFPVSDNPWLQWDGELLLLTLRQSLPLHLGMILFFLHLRLDTFLVKSILGTSALGVYSVSVMLAETMYLAMDSLAVALVPRQVSNKPEEAASYAIRAGRVIVLVGGGVAFLWIVLGWPIIRYLFGADFTAAYLPLVLLLPGLLALGIQRVCGPPILRQGRPGRMAAVYGLGLIANLALNLLLIPRWGINGAAIASTLSYSLGAFVFLAWTVGLVGEPLRAAVVPGRSDVDLLRRSMAELVATIKPTSLGAKRG